MSRFRTLAPVAAGALVVALLVIPAARTTEAALIAPLAERAEAAIERAGGGGVTARFSDRFGAPSRHAMLAGGEGLDMTIRERVAKAIAALPGIGGVHWIDGTVGAGGNDVSMMLGPCQDDVEALLGERAVRFEEGSAAIEPSSIPLLDEVATTLRPCAGSIVLISGHSDRSGAEPANIAISRDRATAVRDALVARGIPRDALRVRAFGSREPIEGLAPGDPANRRIEFTVLSTAQVRPTPVDTPGAR